MTDIIQIYEILQDSQAIRNYFFIYLLIRVSNITIIVFIGLLLQRINWRQFGPKQLGNAWHTPGT